MEPHLIRPAGLSYRMAGIRFGDSMTKKIRIHCPLVTALLTGCFFLSALYGAPETELKDDRGKVIIRYVVEPPVKVAAAKALSCKCQISLTMERFGMPTSM
jgi:hypothetical protein